MNLFLKIEIIIFSNNMKTIIRNTFHGYDPIEIPIYYNKKIIMVDCKEHCNLKNNLQCIITYRRGLIYTIDWNGPRHKSKEIFSYKTKNDKKYIYVQKINYERSVTTKKELDFIIDEENDEKYNHFDEECCICDQPCNELSGWLCVKCDSAYCDEHNCEEFLCDC